MQFVLREFQHPALHELLRSTGWGREPHLRGNLCFLGCCRPMRMLGRNSKIGHARYEKEEDKLRLVHSSVWACVRGHASVERPNLWLDL